MRNTKIPTVLHFLGTLLLMVSIFAYHETQVRADAPAIIINEIMYHPDSDIDFDEFLEIHNTTASPIDLTDWCFTDGIVLCFGSGVTIAANSYEVVSPNSAQTQATYNKTPIGIYTGKLDNGGETITLRDNNSVIVNSLTYDDVPPWPTSPDGTGPSLALKDPEMDNTVATSWAACPCGSSPGVANEVFTAGLPDLINLSTPQNVTPSTTPTVTVEATNVTSVSLVYKVMFNAEQTLTMYDDGNHYDGTAGDGQYGATIPAQAAGKLVRYKVSATNGNGTQTKPGGEETINYQGYTVQDSATTSELPIFQWFMDPTTLETMVEDHSFDDAEFPAIVAYDNVVIDNASIHIKGSTTRGLPKKAFAIDLPQGHTLQMAGMTRAVDEFHLNSTYLDTSGIMDIMAWRLAENIGMPVTQTFKIRLQHNGEFYGLYTFAEEYDKSWREEFGYQDGSFYKDGRKKTRLDIDDGTEVSDWNEGTLAKTPTDRTLFAVDNQDIPNTLNFMAFQVFIRNADWTFGKNWNIYHDIPNTGRWKMMPYDLDGAGGHGSASVAGLNYVSPYEFPGGSESIERSWRGPVFALYDDLAFREAYYRRLRTLTDDYLLSGWYRAQYEDLKDKTETEFWLDYAKWGGLTDPQYTLDSIDKVITEMEYNFTKRFQKPWAVPAAQSPTALVEINAVEATFGNQQTDYITLKNNTDSAVDMTNWTIPELNFTFPIGSVIASGQTAYIPRNDPVFTSSHPGSYVIGQLNQDIPLLGTLTLMRQNGSQSDSYEVL